MNIHHEPSPPLLMLFMLRERNGWLLSDMKILELPSSSSHPSVSVSLLRLAVFDDRSSVPRIRETSFEDRRAAYTRRCMKMSVYSFSHDSANRIFDYEYTRYLIFKFLCAANDACLWIRTFIHWNFKLISLTRYRKILRVYIRRFKIGKILKLKKKRFKNVFSNSTEKRWNEHYYFRNLISARLTKSFKKINFPV